MVMNALKCSMVSGNRSGCYWQPWKGWDSISATWLFQAMVQQDIIIEPGYVHPEFISNYVGRRFQCQNRRIFCWQGINILNELIVQSAN